MRRMLALVCVLGVAGCANLDTVGRSTVIPGETDGGSGKAIHLDAQQRVVVVDSIGKFCAEPSPDALAAYAASLGFGLSAPGTGAGSLSAAQQSAAASIGLRTQSITLMRDALYRMCEAFANEAVSPAQTATLLGRSQDLTAVILAVEQLTGAVAASQVVLGGSTSADASAALLSNQGLLDQAREDEEAKRQALEQAESDRDAKQTMVSKAQQAEKTARATLSAREAPDSGATPEEIAEAKGQVKQREEERIRLEGELEALETQVRAKDQAYSQAKRNRELIEANRDSAFTSANAGTTGSGQFSNYPVARQPLSKEATEAVAASVEAMVKEVLNKDYTVESCMGMLTYIPPASMNDTQLGVLGEVRNACRYYVFNALNYREERRYGADELSKVIQDHISASDENRASLVNWMAANTNESDPIRFIYNAIHAEDRRRFVEEVLRR